MSKSAPLGVTRRLPTRHALAAPVELREGESVDARTGEAKPWRAYAATVRVTVPGSQPRVDVGFQAVADDTVEGHETAYKGSVTDALKRALRSYGSQFGNGLYGDGAAGDLAPSLRTTLVALGERRGFGEQKVRAAVRERTGRDLDELSEGAGAARPRRRRTPGGSTRARLRHPHGHARHHGADGGAPLPPRLPGRGHEGRRRPARAPRGVGRQARRGGR